MCLIRNIVRPVGISQLHTSRLFLSFLRPPLQALRTPRSSAYSTDPSLFDPFASERKTLKRDTRKSNFPRIHSPRLRNKTSSHSFAHVLKTAAAHPRNLPRITSGLFGKDSVVVPSHRFTRSKFSAARYFVFTKRAANPTRSPEARPTLWTKSQRRPSGMLNYVQIISTPTADTPGTCLLVHHDNRRYLFGNIAEGTQRTFVQQKVSLARTEEIFLTGPINWGTTGGLLGMILTVAEVLQSARSASLEDAKNKATRLKNSNQKNSEVAIARAQEAVAAAMNSKPKPFSIHGGKNLGQLLATARRFVFRKGLPIRPHEIREDNSRPDEGTDMSSLRKADWSDENMMVWYVPVFADGADKSAAAPETSSRKRSFEDLESDSNAASDKVKTFSAEERDKEDRKLIENVVHHMFDSDWTFDALTESTLHTVKLPAKLYVKENGHLKPYKGPLPGDQPHVPDITVFVREPWPAAMIQALPKTHEVRQSMSYIVRNHPRRGKVNAAECARLGVKKPDIRFLADGKSVTATDGSTVTPEMVVGATVEGASFAVIDLPDASYIDAFLAKPEWANAGLMNVINTIFWILGPGVVSDERIKAFMAKHSHIRHTVSSKDTCPNNLALTSAAAVQMKHNRVDPDRFPIQSYNNTASLILPSTEVTADKDVQNKPGQEAAQAGWSIRLAPQVIVEEKKVYPLLNVTESCQLEKNVLKLATAARAKVAEPKFLESVDAGNRNLPRPDVEVIPLGTGSAMPSKYRNVSATLVRVPGVGSYIFDAGENTLGSMRRLLGDEKLDEVLKELRAVWISHLHADHHLGTVSVIRAWRDATENMKTASGGKPRLLFASHVNMLHWLREYSEIENFGIERMYMVDVGCRDLRQSRICPPFILNSDDAAEFGLARIDACAVEHCHGALAVVFTWPAETPGAQPFKVSYSGDCRPSADFADIGRNTTLLIHESTFDDDLAGEAVAKKHSTMGEAIDMGRRMGARRLLLTHFSQRYPKIASFNTEEPSNTGNKEDAMQILIAFDQMSVKLRDFKTAAAFLPAFQKMYEEDESV